VGLDIVKLTKNAPVYRSSRFNLRGLAALFGGLSSPKPPVATGLGLLGDFSKIFLEKSKSGEICFFPLENNLLLQPQCCVALSHLTGKSNPRPAA